MEITAVNTSQWSAQAEPVLPPKMFVVLAVAMLFIYIGERYA